MRSGCALSLHSDFNYSTVTVEDRRDLDYRNDIVSNHSPKRRNFMAGMIGPHVLLQVVAVRYNLRTDGTLVLGWNVDGSVHL